MALKVGDRVKQTSTTTGTGTITLDGAAPTGFSNFRDYLLDGDTTYYVIEDGTNYEIGVGTFNTGGQATADTIARASDANVYRSTNSNNRVNWSSGTRSVFISLPSDKAVFEDALGDLSFTGDVTFDSTNSSAYDVTWDSSEGHLIFNDSAKAYFGTDKDMQITSTHVYSRVLAESLFLQLSNTKENGDILLQTDDGSGDLATYVQCDGGTGEVMLNYYGSTKLTTKTGGVDITGSLTTDGLTVDGTTTFNDDVTFTGTGKNLLWDQSINHLSFDDDVRASFGNSGDFKIRHQSSGTGGNETHLDNTTGNLNIVNFADDKDIILSSDDGSNGTTAYITLDGSEGEVQLSHYGSEKLATKSTGVNVTGTVTDDGATHDGDVTFTGDNYNVLWDKSQDSLEFADSARATFGSSRDFQLQFNGSNGLIENYTGDLFISNFANDQDIFIRSDNGSGGFTTYVKAEGSTGEAQLYHYGTEKLATKSTGVDVTGVLTTDGATHNGDVTFTGASYNVQWDKSHNTLNLLDVAQLHFGSSLSSGDLRIFHNLTDSFIQNINGDFNLINYANDKDIIFSSDNGSGSIAEYIKLDGSTGEVLLNHYGSNKLATKSTGVDITGDITLTSTNAGSTDGPTITLKRDSASPGNFDDIGEIEFLGENSASEEIRYGHIKTQITNPTDGAEESRMVFSIFNDGADKEMMFLDSIHGGGSVYLTSGIDLVFEGSSNNTNETTLTVSGPNQDNTITLPDATGTVVLQNASIDMNGTELVLDVDGDTSIIADIDDRIDFKVGGTFRMGITDSLLNFTGNLLLSSTDAGATTDPTLTLYRNSASPALQDLIGKVSFQGENDASQIVNYAGINGRITGITDGNEHGEIDFTVISNGNQITPFILKGNGNTVFQARNVLIGNTASLIFEGSTNDNNEITIAVTDPTADRTITLPDATGQVVLSSGGIGSDSFAEIGTTHIGYVGWTNIAGFSHIDQNSQFNYALLQDGNGTTYLNARSSTSIRIRNNNSDVAQFNSDGLFIHPNKVISFEGATNNSHETTLTVTDPTADRTITLPDATGTVLLNAGDQTFTGDLTFPDSQEIKLGTGEDLRIFHDGTNNIFRGASNPMWIQTNSTIYLTKNAASEYMAKFISDGAVELYHDNSKKFETTSTGIKTTGTLDINSAYTFPTSDGSANQVLQTDGSGTLSFATVSGGGGGSSFTTDITSIVSGGADLILQNSKTTVSSGTRLGRIQFQAPNESSGGDAILVSAEIDVQAAGTFASNANPTDFIFKLGTSSSPVEVARIHNTGNLQIKDSQSAYYTGGGMLFVAPSIYASFYDNTGGLTIASAVGIKYDSTARSSNSNIFSLDASTGEVTVNRPGDYQITYDVTTAIESSGGSSRSETKVKLQKKTSGGTFSEVSGSLSYIYNRTQSTGEATCTATIIDFALIGQIYRVQAERESGTSTITTTPKGSRLNFLLVGGQT